MAAQKKRGEAKAVLFLMSFFVVAMLSSGIVTGACFTATVERQGSEDASFTDGGAVFDDRFEERCERLGGHWHDHSGSEDHCHLSRSVTSEADICYTAQSANNRNDRSSQDPNQVCLINSANTDGECVSERETGDFCCIVDGRSVTITREEFDQASDEIKQSCLPPEQEGNFAQGPGILHPNGQCDLEEITERVNLDSKIEQEAACPAGQTVCGAKEKNDDPADKTGLDFIQCCTVNEPVQITNPAAQGIVFPAEGEQEERTVQCPIAKPVLCGTIKNAETNEFAQMQCCTLEGIPIETRNPRQLVIKDAEQQCDNNEFACGFVQAQARANFGNEQFINAPGGILCCKDRTGIERAEDRDDDKVLNENDKCPDTPAGERQRIIQPTDVQQHPELAPFLGCGPSEVDADEKPFICEEMDKGTWLTRKDENFQMIFDQAGACCGGGLRLESFSKEGQGVTQACLWNEPLTSAARGGGDILHPLKPLGDSVPSIGFRAGDSFEPPSVNRETGEPTYRIEDGAVVIPPGGSVRMKEVTRPNGNIFTLAFDYLISHPEDILDVRQTIANGQPVSTRTEYVSSAFQRKKILLIPQETFHIRFINPSEHPVRIRGEEIYAEKARKVLHANGEFFGCAMDENTRQSISRSNPKTEQRLGELIPAAKVVQPSCAADQKKEGFYCSFENVWKKGANRNEEKQIPPDELLRSVEINPETFPSSSEKDCCAVNECWTGVRCVPNNFDAHFASRNGQKALFCSNGEWKLGDRKTNQFDDGSRVCPGDACAYKVTAHGREEMTCMPNGFYGPANNGGSGEDIFCDAGEWTSRPVKLAGILANLPDTRLIDRVGLSYSIYCDTPEEVLVNKDFSPVLPNEVSKFMQQDGAAFACVLETNTHASLNILFKGLLSEIPLSKNNVIVALALTDTEAAIKAPSEDQFVLSALDPTYGAQDVIGGETLFTQCLGATSKSFRDPAVESAGFHACVGVSNEEPDEANLWYNRRLNTILYSPKAFRVG